MWNIIAHHYDRVDLDFFWNAATEALASLVEQITPHFNPEP